ncbi:MAG: lantibiotic dehydratase family protein, partial [Flavobacterium sp.]
MHSIHNLERAFIRTPLYSFKEYRLIPKETGQLDLFIGKLWEDKIFKEALLLASSELYLEWERSNNEDNYLKSKKEKINLSILKYYIRITTRSTPFGLFSSYSDFEIEETTTVENSELDLDNLERFTTFDLAFLYNLSRHLNNNSTIRQILKYTVNNSIYKIGDSYRYVEVLLKNDKREHILTSLESDEVLELLFSNCETEKSIHELSILLVDHVEDVTYDQAFDYINSLIDEQVLISHLDICLNQRSPLDQILSFLEENKTTIEQHPELNALFFNLQHLKSKLDELDHTIGNDFGKYNEIYTLVNQLNISYSKKNIINVNLRKNANSSFINKQDIHKIKKAIKVLSMFSDELSTINADSHLEKFKNAFYKRYEEKEIPLTLALDNEVGIGYVQSNNENNDFSSLLNDIQFEHKPTHIETIKYNNKTHLFWSTLFYDALRNKKTEINLKNVDLSEFTEKFSKLSRTFAVIVSKTNNKIVIDHVGESSSLNLIARFSNADTKLNDLINESTKTEEVSDDIIHVELLHIPNDRDGNILLRKIDRQFELPFLTKASTDAETISIQDISVSIKKNKVVLWSKKLNKQIKIFNSTAHNYHFNSLPIYQLLCDLQYQDILPALSLNFGFTNTNTFQFTPRVVYGDDVVLSAAKWKLNYDDLKYCYDEKTGTVDVQKFATFRTTN